MTSTLLHHKLDRARFPNLCPQMAPILGFVLEREFTIPALAELVVTPDAYVLARPASEVRSLAHLAAEADLRANASTTEEPDAGELHGRDCAGVPGDRRPYGLGGLTKL